MAELSEVAATRPPNFPDRCVMMWRMDGLCQRIIATINGLVIASECDLQFKLAWVNEKSMKSRFNAEYHTPNDMPDDPHRIFSESFIEKYFIEDRDIYYPPELVRRKRKSRTNTPGREELIMDTKADYEKAVNHDSFFGIAPAGLREEFVPDYLAKCRSVARSGIFSEEIESLLSRIDNIPALRNMRAIHLRSGDVIYGEARKRFPRRRNWAITIPVAIDLCNQARSFDKKCLVVGATTQDIDLVLSRCPNAVCAKDIDLPPTFGASAVVRDVFLTSQCEQMFTSKSSAVVRLAEYFGKSERTESVSFYSGNSETGVLKTSLESEELESCSDFQKAFIYYNLFVLNWNRSTFSEVDEYLALAFELDPENLSYIALRYLNFLSFSKFQRARRFTRKFRRLTGIDAHGRKNLVRELKRNIGFRSKFMESFLIHIYRNADLPEKERRMIGRWIEQFYSTDLV
jgi:hypothetical protein